ncbi:hypothetical protein [Planktothrix agardhii]|uniref:hypothetical protein n=1 Tax=Planktothrix agardhii TaxID=1160 RepID=UPI001B8F8906|nr:hypothetical protein [Planktothrix agardhii]CAD0229264.1 conserved hypothetical protein [Planktothrix agardhii]CAD5973702.1 hypothetical protein NO758_03944 [Planktothrix agardhii]
MRQQFIAILLTQFLKIYNPNQRLSGASFIIQATCIDAIGVASILSGIPLMLVILLMIAQGTYLIIDAHRSFSQK